MEPTIDRARLAGHIARVDGALDPAACSSVFGRWRREEAGARLVASDPDALVAAAIAAAAQRIDTDPDDVEAIHFLDAEGVADEIGRSRRPVDAADAVLMVLLATDPRCWYYEIRVALHLAERALEAVPGQPEILAALTVLRDRLAEDRLHGSDFFARKLRPWLGRLLAEQAPGGMLDLSFVDGRDPWGRAAAVAISQTADAEAEAGAFAIRLASPRGTRASAAWWRETATAMDAAWAQALVVELVAYLGVVDLTPADPEIDGFDAPTEHLVVPTNVPLARGVLWAASFVRDHDSPARIGLVVERAGDPVPGFHGRQARCSPLALAGLLTLERLGSDRATAELERLYDGLTLAPLVRRAGAALGLDEDTLRTRVRRR